MLDTTGLIEDLSKFGVGRRRLDDQLFRAERAPARLGIYDEDDEDLSHEPETWACAVPSCAYVAGSLADWERHYNASHRYSCGQCRRALPSPHLLDLHVQESHDSFFAVMAARRPSYCCYIQECTDKFTNAEERLEHCVKVHKLPKDFRFEIKPKGKSKKKNKSQNVAASMDVDVPVSSDKPQKIFFHNSKQKALVNYTGKKFTTDKPKSTTTTDVDEIMSDLKESLPQ